MKPAVLLLSATITLASAISQPVHAFGQIGHRIIGELAQNNLSPTAKSNINALTKGESLAQMSTWPDEIRSDKNWYHASPWHYVSIEDDETWETVTRNPKGDIIESLERYEKILIDPKTTKKDKWEALAFYVHFVGDIHQPLHVGHSHDHGGNKVKLKWFGDDTNLHSVWDSKIIEHQKLSYTEYTGFIERISDKDIKNWQGKSYYDWADESKALRAGTYELEKNRDDQPDLRFQYIFNHTPTVELRLQQAGIRLAEKLNVIFGQ
ncbi:S1/P1 nuclease [Shewanella sp. 10N.7]|uniref:S1/P1 nuclease n=1 Tax=Shewanella sp. 10N.7 TaxID=2885093 RepID=UPI001E44A339|nr:S1/P1 nuclease [Shewanella sp. 10N.7]MCC4834948.1 S1/P1 nuclease [Shewanella sp. 10N.7]